jgi:hypothetical protein
MSYVDAGYVIALSVLALYALSLILRARRLERAVGASRPPGATGATGVTGTTGVSDVGPAPAVRVAEAAPVDPRR